MEKSSFSNEQISLLEAAADVTFYQLKQQISNDQLIAIIKDYEYVGITRRPSKDLDSCFFQQLSQLKGLAIYSTGYEWVDVQFAMSQGIKLSYLPDYSTVSVAEHAVGMLLSVLHRIHLSYDYSRDFLKTGVSMRGYELQGKKVGIVGFGKIGKKVFEMLKGFLVKVTYFDTNEAVQSEYPMLFEEKDELLRTSDVIILCSSKRRNLSYIIDFEDVDLMKQGVCIINPARVDLVNNEAILKGISSKKIFTYAVDEKVEYFKNRVEPGRILCTGHTGWYTSEALERGTEQWVQNILSLLRGEPKNLINYDDK